MENNQEPIDASKMQVKSTPPIKFKDKAGRGGIMLDLKKSFGFIPEQMVIQKVHGESNKIVVSAILTEAELAKEAKNRAVEPKDLNKKMVLDPKEVVQGKEGERNVR